MPIKPRHKRRTFWVIITLIALLIAGLIVLPSFINLNKMRDRIESAILAQTGVATQINGDITFGILGRTTIVAHDVRLPHGTAKKIAVKIPFMGLFNPLGTTLTGEISATGANIQLTSLAALNLKYDLVVHDSVVRFMDKNYHIINGVFSKGTFNGQIRTGQHKYDIRFNDKEFTVKNKNMNLNISGELYPSGAASGTLEISTDKINSWFEFSEPKITRHVKLVTDFWWDGAYGFKFYDMTANNVHGNIDLESNGWRNINLTSDNTDFDFSFLARAPKILRNTRINIDFMGMLKFENRDFRHIKIDAVGTEQYVQINEIVTDNTVFTGGTIDDNGAHEIMIKTNIDGTPTQCLFSGTPEKWECQKFKYGNITGVLKSNKNSVVANVTSNAQVTPKELGTYVSRIGKKNVNIKFKFANMGGRFISDKNGTKTEYDYVYGKNLHWLNPHIKLLPEFMMNDAGNIIWTDKTMSFIPNSGEWSLTLQDNFFYLTGNSIKKWFSKMDLRAVNDFAYVASGFYNDQGDISDLTIKIAGHVFTGSANSDSITLHTDTLVLNEFLNQNFFDRYEEMEFLANAPILLPFDFERNIYLSVDTLMYDNNAYKNFVYALKSGTQTFSITDNSRGNLLATIIRERSEYDIFLQLNRFVINGELLRRNFPLNIADTSITAEMQLHTNGHIAHDIWYNMAGDIDLTFDGGYINGIGIDEFYANAENLSRLNVEDHLITALESGTTRIKNMRIIGKYERGNFETTKPLTIAVRHADIVGALNITDNMMTTKLDITMRATAPDPVTVSVIVAPNGQRRYSLGEIVRYFDPAFMREFIKTHDRF